MNNDGIELRLTAKYLERHKTRLALAYSNSTRRCGHWLAHRRHYFTSILLGLSAVVTLHFISIEHVMAVSTATKAINTQDITEKARRSLLQLLEAVRGKKSTFCFAVEEVRSTLL